jgi:hypothetical protein
MPKPAHTSGNRSSILAEISALGSAVQGTLTVKTRKLADGRSGVCHQVQRWDKQSKRNVTFHVPASKVAEVRDAIGRGKKRRCSHVGLST